MSRKQSPKDIAFEKERSKYRKEIRQLECENKQLLITISNLKECISQKDSELQEKQDWINRLLEYTELSEDEMRDIIDFQKFSVQLMEKYESLLQSFPIFGR